MGMGHRYSKATTYQTNQSVQPVNSSRLPPTKTTQRKSLQSKRKQSKERIYRSSRRLWNQSAIVEEEEEEDIQSEPKDNNICVLCLVLCLCCYELVTHITLSAILDVVDFNTCVLNLKLEEDNNDNKNNDGPLKTGLIGWRKKKKKKKKGSEMIMIIAPHYQYRA